MNMNSFWAYFESVTKGRNTISGARHTRKILFLQAVTSVGGAPFGVLVCGMAEYRGVSGGPVEPQKGACYGLIIKYNVDREWIEVHIPTIDCVRYYIDATALLRVWSFCVIEHTIYGGEDPVCLMRTDFFLPVIRHLKEAKGYLDGDPNVFLGPLLG